MSKNTLETISTDALVTATGGLYGSGGYAGHHPLLALANSVNNLNANNAANQNTQMMTMAMLGLAMSRRSAWG